VANLLQQLHDDQARLVMYIADELGGEDRADLEQRLSGDANLQGELDRFSEVYGAFSVGMTDLDAATPIHADVSAAVRRASAAIRKWQARPVPHRAPVAEKRSSFGMRTWAIPSAAAAIVLVVMGVSLYNKSLSPRMARGPYPLPAPGLGLPTPPMVVPPAVTPQADDDAGLIAMNLDDGQSPARDEHEDTVVPHEEVAKEDGDSPLFSIPLDGGQ
jgi:hypothetical protein